MGKFLAFLLLALEVAVLALAGALVQGLPLAAAQVSEFFPLDFDLLAVGFNSSFVFYMQRGPALTNVIGPEETVPLEPSLPLVSAVFPSFSGFRQVRGLIFRLIIETVTRCGPHQRAWPHGNACGPPARDRTDQYSCTGEDFLEIFSMSQPH